MIVSDREDDDAPFPSAPIRMESIERSLDGCCRCCQSDSPAATHDVNARSRRVGRIDGREPCAPTEHVRVIDGVPAEPLDRPEAGFASHTCDADSIVRDCGNDTRALRSVLILVYGGGPGFEVVRTLKVQLKI